MSITTGLRRAIRNVALGKTFLPQEFTLGFPDPQTEITVWLHGPAVPIDVTERLSTACAAPFTLCVGLEERELETVGKLPNLTLVFSPRNNRESVLGRIGLEHKRTLAEEHMRFLFFEPGSSQNFCLSAPRTGLHYLLHAYSQWKRDNTKGIRMSFLERRASMVTFIRPHPIFLVSVGTRENGNIFPMNLCGALGGGYFGFALRPERVVGTLVERAGRATLSSIPEAEGHLAYRLASHHTMEAIDWDQLPFSTKLSKRFQTPVPTFTQRVKELEIVTAHAFGSHRFFIGKVVEDERFAEALTFCSIHGFYQFRRLKDQKILEKELARSIAADALHKRGRSWG